MSQSTQSNKTVLPKSITYEYITYMYVQGIAWRHPAFYNNLLAVLADTVLNKLEKQMCASTSCPEFDVSVWSEFLDYKGNLYLTYGTSTSSPSKPLQQSSNTRVLTCGLIFFFETFSTVCEILK